MAWLMHGLVWYTGTLVIAMGVHTVHDIAAGIWAGHEAGRYAVERRLREWV